MTTLEPLLTTQQQQQQQQPNNINIHISINRQNSTAKTLNEIEIKTADITAATDYSQLFRGLSTFTDIDRIDSISTNQNPNTQNDVKSIKQEDDLTDMLIQGQTAINNNNNNVDINNNIVEVPEVKTFNTLNTVKLLPESLPNKENQNQSMVIQPQLIRSARTSTDSNTSSVIQHTIQKKKRGRRPTSMLDASNKQASNRTPTKRERIIEQAQDNGNKVVCFGNKVVEKDTEEYKKRRVSNNEAVKKCRQKLMEEQKEKEDRMKRLDDENKRLNGKVESLQKELSVLKNIIMQMSPHRKIPDNLEKMIKAVEES